MKLLEIMNKKIENFEIITDDELEYEVESKIGDRIINFTASRNKSKIVGEPAWWSVEFSEKLKKDKESLSTKSHTYDLTKSGKEFEVFSFIKQCMEAVIKKHKPEVIIFTADKSDTSRASLYEKMLKKFLYGYKINIDDDYNDKSKQIKFRLEKIK